MTTNAKTILCSALLVTTLITGCDRALVFGDRTGFNLAIRSDTVKGEPLEVNVGLRRQVVGFVPPQGRKDGRADGEAVNMFARTDIRRTEKTTSPLDDKILIRSKFASGAAALAAENNPKAAAAIEKAPKFVQTSDPSDQAVNTKLLNYISQGQPQAEKYLDKAKAEGLSVSKRPDAISSAIETVIDPKNTAGNRKILPTLNI